MCHPTPTLRLAAFAVCVDRLVCISQAVGPKHFPSEQFRVTQHEPPQRDVVAIHRALAASTGADEFLQFRDSLASRGQG